MKWTTLKSPRNGTKNKIICMKEKKPTFGKGFARKVNSHFS